MFIPRMMNRRALTAVLAALLWAVVLSPSPAPAEETAEKPLRIGVPAFRGVAHAMRSWMPMARYLSARVAKARFQIVPLPLPDLRQATEQGTISDAASGLTWQIVGRRQDPRMARRAGLLRRPKPRRA